LTYSEIGGISGPWLNGSATSLDLLKFQKVLEAPLLFAPGKQYCYTNANFNLAGYVIEKVRLFVPYREGKLETFRE
jgi:CubicO group peptidase (beta-lactamase class C family)